ncbi:MAG TPA: hypothetical protein PK939_08715 [Bacteroidales bacterium]|nr:hypothetical protein [Bacteroidales bacterium]
MEIQLIFVVLTVVLVMLYQSWQWTRFGNNLLKSQSQQTDRLMQAMAEGNQKEGFKMMLPLRIQAGERVVLFLERLQPQQLIGRHINEGIDVEMFVISMLRSIKEEFEYNLSQQLFLTDAAWQLTKAAREEVIQLIHLSKAQMEENSTVTDLATTIISAEIKLIDAAIHQIKEDLNKLTS